jgi:hypothetical protein
MVQTQQDAVAQLKQSQQKLDTLVDELAATLPPDSAQPLRQLESRWNALARDDCAWQRDLSGGGSMSSLVYASCLDARIHERINRLKILLCEGYGSTGECSASKRY